MTGESVKAIIGLLAVAAILAAMIAYLKWQARVGARLDASLGFEPGAAGLISEARAFPMTLDGGVAAAPAASAHGLWRGRRAESVLVGPGDQARMIATFRVEVVELTERLPRVEIIARNHFSLVPAGGGDVIDVESSEFDSAFNVLSPDRAYAHAVLHPRMMERLLRADARGVSVTVAGPTVFCWSPSAGGADGAARRLDLLSDVADLLPQFLEGRFSSAPAPASHELPRDVPSASARETSRNWIASLAWGLAATVVLLPVGIGLAHVALRAARAGLATNDANARLLLYLGYGAIALAIVVWTAF